MHLWTKAQIWVRMGQTIRSSPILLQNRIDPFSAFHAVSSRGMFTGNRGIIHDHETQTIIKTSWATEGWVICTLAPLPRREKRSRLMSKGKGTELFFLDEVTGLAAGHRPCFSCQRQRASAFKDAAGVAKTSDLNPLINAERNPVYGCSSRSSQASVIRMTYQMAQCSRSVRQLS